MYMYMYKLMSWVIFDDLDGLCDAIGISCVDACDMLSLPVNLVVLDVGMLHNGRLLKISSVSMCSVFLQPCGEILSCFPDLDLAHMGSGILPLCCWELVCPCGCGEVLETYMYMSEDELEFV